MSRELLRTVLLAALAVLVPAGLFLACFERRSFELPVGASEEARRNDYLALERLLERMGHPVETRDGPGGLDPLPPPDAFLVLPTERRTLTPARSEALRDWVRRGGHLLLVTYSVWDDPERRPDPLLDPLGLQQAVVDPDADEEDGAEEAAPEEGEAPDDGPTEEEIRDREAEEAEEAAEELRRALTGEPGPEPAWDVATLDVPGREEPLRATFLPQFVWRDSEGRATRAMEGETGVHLVHVPLEEGAVTALTDDRLLRNGRLHREDHAELVVRWVRMQGPRAPVWIVTGEAWPGLLAHAATHAAPALWAAGALLLAWLLRAMRRFGPLEPDPPPERRRWIEHLDAVGAFLWRHGAGATLVEGAREAVRRRLRARHPAWLRLPPAARSARLARLAGLPPEAVQQALEDPAAPRGEAGLVTTLDHLERIRTSL